MSPAPFRILHVEDNPANRALVRRVLSQAGYIVFDAKDGLSGILIAEQKQPDLILMDIMLPGLDGHQVTTRLKSLPELAQTPIVALTARVMEGDRERALIAGCDGYIPKPIDVDRLPDQIAEFLKGKRDEIAGGAEERLTLQQEYTEELVLQLEQKVRELEKANIELRRTDELKSKFISIVSHELRTPLAVILGYLAIFKTHTVDLDDKMDKTARLSLTGIDTGVERLRAIIEEMLDVVRIAGKTLQVHKEPVAVKEPMMTAIRALEAAARERKLTIKVGSMENLPLLQADAKYLTRVFYNLLSNAIKYTPDGGWIRISAHPTPGTALAHHGRSISGSDGFVQIVFQDTGIGIAPDEQERIFDLFYEVRDTNLHSTSKTRFLGGGLGLGLAIARGIVQAHQGFLWVESEGFDPERCPGSRFHVLLPVGT